MALFVWGVGGWAALVPLQHRLIGISPEHATVSLGLNASAMYLAIAASGLTGAAGITLVGAHQLGLFGLLFLLLGLLASRTATRLIARARPAAPGGHTERARTPERQSAA